jgi:integrase
VTTPGREVRVAPNIYRTPHGWRVYVKRAGILKPKRFPPDATLESLKEFVESFRQESQRLTEVRRKEAAEHAGTFAADADRYLALKVVHAMPSHADRVREITHWRTVFGRRPRGTITAGAIDEQLQALFDSGYAGSTVNKFRTALMSLYTRLDGRGGANPVRQTRLFEEAEEEARGRSYGLLTRILDAVPAERSRPVKGQQGSRGTGSASRARLEIMAWTGMAPSQIARLDPATHFSIAEGWYVVPRRQKGKKPRFPRPVIRKQMTADARAAFRRFVRLQAYGPFSRSSLRHTWFRAQRRVEAAMRAEKHDDGFQLPRFRLYDIRHSFGTELFKRTKDLALVAEVLDHSSLQMTRRYSLGAVADVLKGAMRKFEAATGRRRAKR